MPDKLHKKIYGKDEAEAFVKEKRSMFVPALPSLLAAGMGSSGGTA